MADAITADTIQTLLSGGSGGLLGLWFFYEKVIKPKKNGNDGSKDSLKKWIEKKFENVSKDMKSNSDTIFGAIDKLRESTSADIKESNNKYQDLNREVGIIQNMIQNIETNQTRNYDELKSLGNRVYHIEQKNAQ